MDLTPEPPADSPELVPDNIVGINPEADRELEMLKVERARKWPCSGRHRKVFVDSVDRKLTCRTCGFVVDPFDYVEEWANDGERRMTGLQRIQTQAKLTAAELAKLTKQLESVRGKLKRDGFPQPEVERQAFKQALLNAEYPGTKFL